CSSVSIISSHRPRCLLFPYPTLFRSALRNLLAIAPCTAASISASSNTIYGALPPSSIETFFIVSAALRTSVFPTAVDPVKEILRSEQHTSELQSREDLVCRLLLEQET